MRKINLTGQRFGRLVVIQEAGHDAHGKALWLCRCDDNNLIVTRSNDLLRGKSRSCGCLKGLHKIRHGHARRGQLSPTFRTWKAMMNRCYNKNASDFEYYGALGTTVYDHWHTSDNFLADIIATIGPRPPGETIDRWPNKTGNYEPGNVRWANSKEQNNNRRPRRQHLRKQHGRWVHVRGTHEK